MRKASVFPLPVTAWKDSKSVFVTESKTVAGTHLYNNILVTHEMRQSRSLNRSHLGKAHGRDSIANPFWQSRSQGIPSTRVLLDRRGLCGCHGKVGRVVGTISRRVRVGIQSSEGSLVAKSEALSENNSTVAYRYGTVLEEC